LREGQPENPRSGTGGYVENTRLKNEALRGTKGAACEACVFATTSGNPGRAGKRLPVRVAFFKLAEGSGMCFSNGN